MAREIGEVQEIATGDFLRFPLGRGVLWEIVWVDHGRRGVWFLAQSSLIKRTFHRDYGFELERVVLCGLAYYRMISNRGIISFPSLDLVRSK